jgi:hypothetical protein
MGICVGETVREARESIRWTVKTFDCRELVNGRLVMDYAPRCRCGVQADR